MAFGGRSETGAGLGQPFIVGHDAASTSCPAGGPEVSTIVLIGNPNTGKSTLFSALSGLQQRIGNFPGVTVEKKVGQYSRNGRNWLLVDLPGTYSLAPRSLDEMVAVDVLLGRSPEVPEPDVVVCVVAADNLERNLYVVSQVLEMGMPVVVALTMVDRAEAQGIRLDASELERRLGVPVVAVQAHRKLGLEAFRQAVEGVTRRAAPVPKSPFPDPFQEEVERVGQLLAESGLPVAAGGVMEEPLPRYLVERLLLDVGGYIEGHLPPRCDRARVRTEVARSRERLATLGYPVPEVETLARYGWVSEVVEGLVSRGDEEEAQASFSERLDGVVTHRVLGSLILGLVLLLIFQAVFSWAQVPMDLIDGAVASAGGFVESRMPEGALRSLIVQGMIGGVGAVVIFLPQILILFFFMGLLEECGYLTRAAYLMDRVMVPLGLSGKSFLPLLSSFACAVPGIMATRVIENRRDRLTTILIAPLMSCSARLPVYTLMIGAFVPATPLLGGLTNLQAVTMLAMYLLGIVTAAVVAFLLKRTLLKGAHPPFVLELPSYRWPSIGVVLRRMTEQAWEFISRAGTLILAVSVVMWALLYYPRLSAEQSAPLVQRQAELEAELTEAQQGGGAEAVARVEAELAQGVHRLEGAQERHSLLGRMGRAIEPLVRPLGWDWRIGSAVIASFPAREVVVSTFGVIFDVGSEAADDVEGTNRLRDSLKQARWEGSDRPLFNLPVALSLIVFFALCAQCVSTLAVIQRETRSWGWTLFSFSYMTVLAYLGALAAYQIGSRFLL